MTLLRSQKLGGVRYLKKAVREALEAEGELALFYQMYNPQNAEGVPRCPYCSNPAYLQMDYAGSQAICPYCYGTTFEGGIKQAYFLPLLFSKPEVRDNHMPYGDLAEQVSNIYFPDFVVVVDETLLSSVDVTAGLKTEGAIVINSSKSPEQLRPLLKGYAGRVCTIDAGKISEEELGKNFPNTPMLAAIVKVSGVVEPDAFIKDMEASFHHKFASKPQVIEGNMRALKRSMEEVQVG